MHISPDGPRAVPASDDSLARFDRPLGQAGRDALFCLHLREILGCSMEWAEDILTRWYLPDEEEIAF